MNKRLAHNQIRLWAVAFWLLVWQLAAALAGQELLLPSPLRVARKLAQLACGRVCKGNYKY